MSSGITFSGVGSGLPVQSWIDAMVSAESKSLNSLYTKSDTLNKAKTTLNSIESSFRNLQSAVQKLTDVNLGSSFDIFAARSATSSNANVATVSAANNASIQNVTLSVESLATATKAYSDNMSQSIDGSELFTDVANKQGTLTAKHEDGTAYGVFSMYVNGKKSEITIEKTDSINSIIKKINDKYDPNGDGDYSDNTVKASLADGKLSITYNNKDSGGNNVSVTLGSSADTTNFFNIMQLSTVQAKSNNDATVDPPFDGTSSFTSSSAVSKINFGGKIIGNQANLNITGDPITAGTIKIGQSEFTIDANTTLATLVSRINSDSKAGVLAQIDSKTNKLVLTSKNAGKTAINIEDGTSNFLSKVGLIKADGDSLSSQVLGNNAKVYINGSNQALEVNSNTIKSDVSGIQGLTISLKNVTTTKNTDGTTTDNPIDINIDQDTAQITNALNDFITDYNKVVSDVNAQTAKGQPLKNEYSLVGLKNNLRSMTSDRVKGLSEYDSLGIIGISTGAVGKDAKNTSSALTLDSNKLLDALKNNPEEVKALLVGDSKKGITGIFQKLETKLDSVLDPVNGYFEARSSSIDSLIASNDKSITKGEDHITRYKAQLTQQFAQMDQYISQMQQQSSAISSIR